MALAQVPACWPRVACGSLCRFADSEPARGGDRLAVADGADGFAGRLGFSGIAAASAAVFLFAPSVAFFIVGSGMEVVGAVVDGIGSGAGLDRVGGSRCCAVGSARLPILCTTSSERGRPAGGAGGSVELERGAAVPLRVEDEATSVVFVLSRHKARSVISVMAERAVTAMNVRMRIREYRLCLLSIQRDRG